jgi:hypothetical protein
MHFLPSLCFTALPLPTVSLSEHASRNYLTLFWAPMHDTDMDAGIYFTSLASGFARTAGWRRQIEVSYLKTYVVDEHCMPNTLLFSKHIMYSLAGLCQNV